MSLFPLPHFAAHTMGGVPPICRGEAAAWLWTHLRRGFPSAFVAMLMPDPLHVIPRVRDQRRARRRLSDILAHFTRNLGRGQNVWWPVDAPIPVRGPKMLARSVRYVSDNPCRENLTRDPLAWNFTTHRDVTGAIADPWVTPEDLARALEWSLQGFQARFHNYVSMDSSVDVRGTPLPRPATPCELAEIPFRNLIWAVASCTRTQPEAVTRPGLPRTLLVHLALVLGWRDPRLLTRVIRTTERSVRRIAAAPLDSNVLRAALLCAGDARLQVHE